VNDRTVAALSVLATAVAAVVGVLVASTAFEGQPEVLPALSAGVGAIVGVLLVRRVN
jgi:hypothetical protein